MSYSTFYRRFFRVYDAFHRYFLWLWLIACVVCFVGLTLKLGDHWTLAICALTIYPLIVGWLGLNGIGGVLKLAPRLIRAKGADSTQALVLPELFLIISITFIGMALFLSFSN